MSISESLDKLGPFCRSAADCTIILDAILGKDPDDPSSRDISLDDPFTLDITNLTVGYLHDAEMEAVMVEMERDGGDGSLEKISLVISGAMTKSNKHGQKAIL